jgi:hypothetical protein
MSACVCFLASRSRSDRSTPQKLFCGSKDSTPACSSIGLSCRIQRFREMQSGRPAVLLRGLGSKDTLNKHCF